MKKKLILLCSLLTFSSIVFAEGEKCDMNKNFEKIIIEPIRFAQVSYDDTKNHTYVDYSAGNMKDGVIYFFKNQITGNLVLDIDFISPEYEEIQKKLNNIPILLGNIQISNASTNKLVKVHDVESKFSSWTKSFNMPNVHKNNITVSTNLGEIEEGEYVMTFDLCLNSEVIDLPKEIKIKKIGVIYQ